MPQRIEVELTSRRDDTTWTWRAAGARQPKGVVDASLLPSEAKVGDVLRAEADVTVEGIDIVSILPPKARSGVEPERLEIKGSGPVEGGVTTQLAKGGRRDRGDRGDRGDRPDRGDRRDRGPRTAERSGDRSGRGERAGAKPGGDTRRPRPERTSRPERPAPEPRPRSKRLKPGRAHRNAVLAAVAPEQRNVAEIVLRGGIPGLRETIDRMNVAAKEQGQPPVAAQPLLTVGEQLLPHLRIAEWHDRADAALAEVDELDLRDLRQVVVAADSNARDDATRELAEQLRTALAGRVDAEHTAWLDELVSLLDDGRVVRALRLSSRPPKAGSRFPAELASRLVAGATASLTADISSDRYATVVDALAYAPVRAQVTPAGVPANPSDALLAVVRKLADRVPLVAAAFGIEAPPARPARGAKRPPRPSAPIPAPPPVEAPAAEAPAAEAPAAGATAAETEVPDAPAAGADAVLPDSPLAAEPEATEPAAAEAPTSDVSPDAG